MNPLRMTARMIIFVVILLGALVACERSEADTDSDETARSNPAVEAEAKEAQAESGEADSNRAESDKAESSKAESGEGPEAEAVVADAPGAGEESAKRKDIRKLLETTGSAKLGIQVANQVLNQLKVTAPNVPEEFWDEFKKDLSERGLVDLIVPIYDRNLTHEEIKALIAFFETPVGRSYVKKLPVITRESQLAGQKWGMEIAQKVQQRLQAKGYR